VDGIQARSLRIAAAVIPTLAFALLPLTVAPPLRAQTLAATTRPARSGSMAYAALAGRRVEDVRVLGNTQVSTAVILNVVRTRTGDKFDPDTVEEDYQRIYGLRKFSNVEAQAEPTATGVVVSFIVTEQKQVRQILYKGNAHVDTPTLQGVVDLHEGEAIDAFRISIARQAIEALYKEKNYPYAHVNVDRDKLAQTGQLTFDIVEGPNVKVRRVNFLGNHSFTDDRLRDVVSTKYWIWIFRPGTYDPETVEDDVAALRRFYESRGFFDARIGRKITESPDQTEIKVTFVIDEGQRYRVESVAFRGNTSVSEADLRRELKLTPGQFYEQDLQQRDLRQIVRAYSPFGFIYQPGSPSPDYLRIVPRQIFKKEAGTVQLVYDISEGKPFKLGRIIVKGNARTQEKVVLREMRVAPGEKYNAAEIADATDRLRGTPYFGNVVMTPIGDDPAVRDLLVEVTEAKTATFGVGAGINSNGGLGANVTYEQRNFDITNWPDSWGDVFSDRAFIGGGQNFRVSLEPGTEASNASIRFSDPWLFDQPYSFTSEAYYRDRIREHWRETRGGGRLTFGKRFDYVHSAALTLRGEDVNVHDIEDDPIRAPEILALAGHSTLTSAALTLRRDTTNRGPLVYRGSATTLGWESYGALGGEFTFQKLTAGWDYYIPVYEDLLDRRTVLGLHADAGWVWGTAPFFERFYAGGIGTVRGFRFRGISPRSGPDDDPVGGDFSITGSAELGFPLYGDNLRGVVFSDVGTVEREFEIGTIRSSVGFGFRLILPIFGNQAPIALDFALPLSKSSEDDTEWLSFSFGIQQ
jgi:outer membrane protein assembly factor BamA